MRFARRWISSRGMGANSPLVVESSFTGSRVPAGSCMYAAMSPTVLHAHVRKVALEVRGLQEVLDRDRRDRGARHRAAPARRAHVDAFASGLGLADAGEEVRIVRGLANEA